jgi:hypothetical protein
LTDQPALVHGLCGIDVLPDGRLAPSLAAGVPQASLLEGRRLTLYVFATAPEAAAFAAGVALAIRNDVRAITGRDGAERVVAVEAAASEFPAPETFEEAVAVEDRGGAGMQRALAIWRMLRHGMPEGLALDISSDGISAALDVGARRFALTMAYGDVTATATYRANAKRVSTALACNLRTSALDFDAIDKTLQVRFPVERFLDKVGLLTLVDDLVADEESRDEFDRLRNLIRRDPAHCRIVEMMLGGWRMSSLHGSVVLVPPAASKARLRPVSGALLHRLVAADLVRKPLGALRRREPHNFAYEIGDLAGSAVHVPTKEVDA